MTTYLNRLPAVLGVLVFLWGSVSLATQTPPLAEDLYIYTIPALPLHENSALSPLPATRSDSPAQHDADLDPDAINNAPFQWKKALRQGLFFTGFMHGFRLATEPQTRDALNGHWWRNYTRSIGETRGWDDGDAFMTSYIAHPFEGAIFGYIAQQNDPRYRRVMWGDGRKYWLARLRTLAFSAAMSTQWTLGPASEASIGNVQLRDSPGFVDLAGTPIFGTLIMIAEDVADRYLVAPLENRTANRPILAFSRCFLTPTRAFANLMAFKYPWHRDGRLGISGENNRMRREMLRDYAEGTGPKLFEYTPPKKRAGEVTHYPIAAPIELESSAHYETFLAGGSCVGGGGSGAVRIKPSWQLIAEVSGCLVVNMPKNESGDSTMYQVGARWTPRAARRVSPFLQLMAGGRRITHEIDDPAKRDELMKEWADGAGPIHFPKREDWSVQHQENGLAMSAGGGVDIALGRAFAWRVGNVEYTRSWLGDV
ncbi:MAG: hypothetical protein QOJ41_314, partial [Acidobacteriaceae bacterium]|nr:hypothetical protein [Acidobacteriaceae bacterium]